MWGMSAVAAARRDPSNWIEDMSWHRRMFRQSYFRWVPEDAMSLALQWTHGRILHETPGHLRTLDQQIIDLQLYSSGIDVATSALLEEARMKSSAADWRAGLALVGLSIDDARNLRFDAQGLPVPQHREVRRALKGWPLPNPFSQVWELRQMRGMYKAAEHLLVDALCDLVVELAPTHGWHNLSQVTRYNNSAKQLRTRVKWQRECRGEPGDERRIPNQTYPAL